MMRPDLTTRRLPWTSRIFVLLSSILLASLAAHADIIYTLNAASHSGQLFTGTFTIPTIPIPVFSPVFTLFTGQITQTTATGTVLDTFVPDESDVEGSVRRFLFDGSHENGRVYGEFYLYVEGSAFTSNLTVCTTLHVCDCAPAATCPSPNPGNTLSFAAYCSDPNYGYGPDPRCEGWDTQDFETATLTGVSTAVTPEPSSLLLLTTGLLSLPLIARSGRKRLALHRAKPYRSAA